MPTSRLFAKHGSLKGTDVVFTDQATIGRDKSNLVVVPSRSVSSRHARIVYAPEEEAFYLEDLGSTNGTELDGIQLAGRERLGRLHVISIASHHNLIYQGPELVTAAAPVFALQLIDLEFAQRVTLPPGETVVGRGAEADVILDSPEISRRHAVLTVLGSRVTLRDEGSQNLTYLAGERIEGEVEVTPGARLRFASIEAQLVKVEAL